MTLYLTFENIGNNTFISSFDGGQYIDLNVTTETAQGLLPYLLTTDKIVTFDQALSRLTTRLDLDDEERVEIREKWIDIAKSIEQSIGRKPGISRVMKATFGESELVNIRIPKLDQPTDIEIFQALHHRLYMIRRLYEYGLNLGYIRVPTKYSETNVEVDYYAANP